MTLTLHQNQRPFVGLATYFDSVAEFDKSDGKTAGIVKMSKSNFVFYVMLIRQ